MKTWHRSSRFLAAFGHLLSREGGYIDSPSDRGGETKFGVSHRAWGHLHDIEELTLEDAGEIAYVHYWLKAGCEGIRDAAVRLELFDSSYLHGVGAGVKLLQKALNRLGAELTVDGGNGDRTSQAANSYRHQATLVKMMNLEQFELFTAIVERDPTQAANFRGWLKRVEL